MVLKYMFNRDWACWEPNNNYNLMFLKHMEEHFNRILCYGEFVSLAEVLIDLGYPRSRIKPWMLLFGWGSIYKGSEGFINFRIWKCMSDRGDYFTIPKDDYIMVDFSGCGQIDVDCYWCLTKAQRQRR